jgi:hypothetical protein
MSDAERPVTLFRPASMEPDVTQDKIGFETIGQRLQNLFANCFGFSQLAIAPQCLGQGDLDVYLLWIFARHSPKFIGRLLEESAPSVEPAKSTSRQFDTEKFSDLKPFVNLSQLRSDVTVAWCQFKGSLPLPQRFFQSLFFCIDDAQTDT